jgi:tRNA modification GTPase
MFSTDDTIVAIATPPGRGGIGIVRLSGARARAIAERMLDRPLGPARSATLARAITSAETGAGSTESRPVDQVVATFFEAPASYTGEDVVELGAHGSPVVLRAIVEACVRGGARLAEAGEFTLRAFLRGKLDLVQAEAVADLVDAVTPLQARAAFDQLEGTLTIAIAGAERELFELIATFEASIDFPEEGYHFVERGEGAGRIRKLISVLDDRLRDGRRGRLVREGRQVAIVGAPNTGKSSIFNNLAGSDRAIVAAMPGTTRDLVSEVVDLAGLRVALVDTAGLRASGDLVEREGVTRAQKAGAIADAVVLVLDRSRELSDEDQMVLTQTAEQPRVLAANKSDLVPAWSPGEVRAGSSRLVVTSAKTGVGLDELREAIVGVLEGEEPRRDVPAITNVRHIALLERAKAALERALGALEAAGGPLPEEFVVADLQEAQAALEEVTGKRGSEDLLRHIFERFCVGK